MKSKTKTLLILCIGIAGSVISAWVFNFNIVYLAVFFLSFLGFITLAILVIAAVMDPGNDDFDDSQIRSNPKPDQWDKTFEN